MRSLLLAGGIVFILAGPTWIQLLGGYLTPLARSWRMYKLVGIANCEVRYERSLPDGRTEPVDRMAVLGAERPRNHGMYRLANAQTVRQHSQALCKALGPGADLRLHARCPSLEGWTVIDEGNASVCP
ncbi:MAG: hypothetical protein H6736_12915 [Alphaproteobacteria bacterium]|nr:hypothetical protein [Alphaproteobacteria bacterium]